MPRPSIGWPPIPERLRVENLIVAIPLGKDQSRFDDEEPAVASPNSRACLRLTKSRARVSPAEMQPASRITATGPGTASTWASSSSP